MFHPSSKDKKVATYNAFQAIILNVIDFEKNAQKNSDTQFQLVVLSLKMSR